MLAHIAQWRHAQNESQNLFATEVSVSDLLGHLHYYYLLLGVHAELISEVHEDDILIE